MAAGEWQTKRLLARRPPFSAQVIDELVDGDQVHWQNHGFGPWVLIEKETGAFAGRGGLAWTTIEGTAQIELPWSIEPHLHGKGLATEAATAACGWAHELGFAEVIALTLPTNLASQRVAEKVGFEQVGVVTHAGLPHLLFRLRL